MPVIVNLLLWLHFIALGMGVGGGIAMSQVGPRLVAAAPEQRATWWPLATVFSRIAGAGLVLLLITGPLLLWLKYDGMEGLNDWFKLKLGLVAVAVATIGLSMWGLARLKRGDEGGGKLMKLTGPLTMLAVLGVILAAVFTFNP
jgi:hypothetical protein